MEKELKIIPPEGYEVDKENSTFECIKFKPIEPQLPKTWKEFCELYPAKEGEAYNKNVLPSEKYAKAILALCQLIQLRDCYNDGWQPDWDEEYDKWCIEVFRGKID